MDQAGHPCSSVTNITAVASADTVEFSWSLCSTSSKNQIRYRVAGTSAWNYLKTASTPSATITFPTDDPVIYQVTACTDTANHWSLLDTFYFPGASSLNPNIIVILLDDSRYDTYSCNGAPPWFQSPNIDRIANEGVNFKNAFVIYSLCNPSRATIQTGLYANKNGAVNNKTMFDTSLPTIATVLNERGYYTAFMGKYMNAGDDNPLPQPGWNWWMARVKSGQKNATFDYNGTNKYMSGFVTDVLTDSAVALINRIPHPFFIQMCFSATHPPYVPRTAEKNLYLNDTMPFPDNFYPYTQNYPSFYSQPNFTLTDSQTIVDDYRGYFQTMKGVDEDLAKIFSALSNKQILDSTLILFTSDNGFLLGEHQLDGKRLPTEESMRVPMFIRYPKWFSPATIDTNHLVLNVDIASTLYDAAGVATPPSSDGASMRKLSTDEIARTSFYYQATSINDSAVNCRSVRSYQYKYNYYFCDSITEEFFNLIADPQENMNLINTSSYQVLIQQYRDRLDSFKLALDDNTVESIDDCHIANPVYTKQLEADESPGIQTFLRLYPNPATNKIDVYSVIENDNALCQIELRNILGEELLQQFIKVSDGILEVNLSLDQLNSGLYLLIIKSNVVQTMPLLIQK